MRTEDEHPLKIKEVKLLTEYFHKLNLEYYSLFTLLAVPFRSTFIFNGLHRFLVFLDKIIFHIPFIKRYAWVVLIHASNPKK